MSDLYSANVALLLHMEGSNNSTLFADSSSATPKAITRYGDAKISTAQSKWGLGAGYFDGNGDYLSVADSADWFFSGDFTIEFYAYITVNGEFEFIAQRDASYPFWGFRRNVGGALRFFYVINSSGVTVTDITSTVVVGLNSWQHIAVTRQSGTAKFWIDGVQSAVTGTNLTTGYLDSPFSLLIGRSDPSVASNYYNGYLQDLRITKGVARYIADFTPPAARLPDPDPVSGLIIPSGYRQDIEDGGAFRITGIVTELGIAGRYRVRLFDRKSARCIREVWSAADGSYSFQNIAYRENGYFVIAYDHGDNPLNAAIGDLVTPEPML